MNKLQLEYAKWNEFYTALQTVGVSKNNQVIRTIGEKYVNGSIGINEAITLAKKENQNAI